MTGERRTVLVLIDLVQDAEVLLPIVARLTQTPGIRLRVVVSHWLRRRAPRTPALLKACGAGFEYVQRPHLLAGRGPDLAGVDTVLTASESTAGPHRWGHALTLRARASGCRTFTVQHGLDNLRVLTGPEPLRFASHAMFCWSDPARLPPELDPDVRARLICVGRTVAVGPPPAPRFDVGIFENLHAKAYGDQQRQLVLTRILELARRRPDRRILVRTHPAGGWLDRAAGPLTSQPNITYVSSAEARRSLAPASAAAGAAARVITTPSTLALDAALCDRPVALAMDGDALYEPLPVLRSLESWLEFVDAPARPGPAEPAFVARHLMTGDAVGRVLICLSEQTSLPQSNNGNLFKN